MFELCISPGPSLLQRLCRFPAYRECGRNARSFPRRPNIFSAAGEVQCRTHCQRRSRQAAASRSLGSFGFFGSSRSSSCQRRNSSCLWFSPFFSCETLLYRQCRGEDLAGVAKLEGGTVRDAHESAQEIHDLLCIFVCSKSILFQISSYISLHCSAIIVSVSLPLAQFSVSTVYSCILLYVSCNFFLYCLFFSTAESWGTCQLSVCEASGRFQMKVPGSSRIPKKVPAKD